MKINELNYIGNDDEFYTQEGNIVSELGHYANDFNEAAIYLPCDNPHESKFFKYFKDNFSSLGIRKLCATFTSDAPYMTFYDGISTRTEPIQSGRFQDNVVLMKDCDIVVTNPPFSDQQAIALIEMTMALGKDFIIVAPSSILRKPEIFEMLKGGEINVGYTSIGRFTRPVGPKKKASTVWLTSLSVDKPDFNTKNEFDEIKHRKYDNYDAIDCGTKDFGTTYEDIPSGYDGNIGVTHSFLRRLNRNQYELVDILDRPVINGKELDTRFIIRLKQPVGVSEAKEMKLISPEEAELGGFAVPKEHLVYGDFIEPQNVGKAYKVFFLGKDGNLYPPVIPNDDAIATPIGTWLPCSSPNIIGYTLKDHRPKVASGGKGTRGKSLGPLAFRPGWHMGEIPYAEQFLKKQSVNGKRVWPDNLIWAECLYSNDVDYNEEAMSYGYTKNGKFRHSYAGLPRIPKGGAYKYRTNPDPNTVAWVIAGAIKVERVLTFDEVNEILRNEGIEPPIVMSEREYKMATSKKNKKTIPESKIFSKKQLAEMRLITEGKRDKQEDNKTFRRARGKTM